MSERNVVDLLIAYHQVAHRLLFSGDLRAHHEELIEVHDEVARAMPELMMRPELAPTDPQPMPTTNEHPAIQDLVMADFAARKADGIGKYGTALQPFNGRDPLVDLYQELLDACQYCRQALAERDGR